MNGKMQLHVVSVDRERVLRRLRELYPWASDIEVRGVLEFLKTISPLVPLPPEGNEEARTPFALAAGVYNALGAVAKFLEGTIESLDEPGDDVSDDERRCARRTLATIGRVLAIAAALSGLMLEEALEGRGKVKASELGGEPSAQA